nr:MAG TPA: hypothetical protein [Caudoviricetes sp.]
MQNQKRPFHNERFPYKQSLSRPYLLTNLLLTYL